MEITVDIRQFEQAIRQYEKAMTEHNMPYILNRAGRNVATKASKNTPKATISHIDADLAKPSDIAGYGPLIFALTNARRKRIGLPAVGGKEMSEPARAFKKLRHSSRAYIAAGWTPAIVKFGGTSRAHIPSGSKIRKAENRMATAHDLAAYLENTANGAGEVGSQALQKAIVETSHDMLSYANKRLADTSKKYSAK